MVACTFRWPKLFLVLIIRFCDYRFVINLLIINLLSSLLLTPLLLVDQSTPGVLANNSTTNESVEILIHEELFENVTSFQIIETSESVLSSVTILNASAFPNNQTVLCYVAQVSTSFVCTLSILSILLIGINQYFGVLHSLRYHFYINKCRSTISIITTWFLAILFSILSSTTDSDSFLWHFCRDRHQNSRVVLILNTVYSITYCVTVILVPFIAICIIYVCIYTAAHKNSERMRKSTSTYLDGYRLYDERTYTLPKVRSAPDFMNLGVTSPNAMRKVIRTSSERTANNFITSIKHKISNASVFKYREETRAAKISVLVIFLVLFCYVPYGVLLVLKSGMLDFKLASSLNYYALVLLVLSNTISPFLFGYRNKRVKREIGKVFGLVPPKQGDLSILNRRRSTNDEPISLKEPFLGEACTVPEVIVTCKVENERKSILKRVCQSSNWASYKKCNFITVPESCISGEARGSFSSASTQISNEDC